MKIHFVYAGYYYPVGYEFDDRLSSFIRAGMKKCKVKSVMVTMIHMAKREIVTKETMEKYCKGEKWQKNSVNEDLESFFDDIRFGKVPDEVITTYFFPKYVNIYRSISKLSYIDRYMKKLENFDRYMQQFLKVQTFIYRSI